MANIKEHELDFNNGGAFYKYQHGSTPHMELDDFRPKVKPLIMYKQFKLRLDKDGNNLAPGYVFPLYVNTESGEKGNKSKGLKLGTWYKSGSGECWLNTKNGKSYTTGKGYGTDGNTIGILAYRPGWHLTNTPWGNQRGANKVVGGKKGTGNNYRNTRDSEVWAKVEICVDVEATEMAKKIAQDKKLAKHGVKLKDGEQDYDPSEAYFDKLGDSYAYLFKTNTNASEDQTWYIVDKIRIVEILDDDTVDGINDEFYQGLQKKYPDRKINDNPNEFTKDSKDIPYWKMPRVNGKRYSKDELLNMGYTPQQLTQVESRRINTNKTIIRLTESELHKIIKESVNRILLSRNK